MTTCARGCCWSPYSCSRAYTCACHRASQRPARTPGGADATYNDPTARQAINNIMNQGRKPR